MKSSQLFTKTSKNIPTEETSKNAQLLLRAGFIEKELAGVYSYLPLGKRVLDKIVNVIREEMNDIGGQEVLLTVMQSKELWLKSGRWDDQVVDVWFKSKLHSGGEVGLGFTHEEPMTRMLKNHITSYKDLPLYIYQIQTKFRNELRAKSGLMRGREFLMKDMYSFARSESEHQELFNKVKNTYEKIIKRVGLSDITFFTAASGGSFSSDFSYEFQTITDSGEDTIYLDRDQGIAINDEIMGDEVVNKLGLNKAKLEVVKASEVGNIFNLGTKFSKTLNLTFLDEENQTKNLIMGCYGMGVSRLMGVIAEVMADDRGMVWPNEIAPAQVYLIGMGSDEAIKQANMLYKRLTDNGIEVLYDDRSIHPGAKFADADLMGIPNRVVISEKTMSQAKVELKYRISESSNLVTIDQLVKELSIK